MLVLVLRRDEVADAAGEFGVGGGLAGHVAEGWGPGCDCGGVVGGWCGWVFGGWSLGRVGLRGWRSGVGLWVKCLRVGGRDEREGLVVG